MSESEAESIPVPPEDAPWWGVVDGFALSFNAYDRMGGMDPVAALANSVEQGFKVDGALPEDVDSLRACLFFEQRRWRHFDHDPYDNEMVHSYLTALLRKIRQVSGGTIPGPPDPSP